MSLDEFIEINKIVLDDKTEEKNFLFEFIDNLMTFEKKYKTIDSDTFFKIIFLIDDELKKLK